MLTKRVKTLTEVKSPHDDSRVREKEAARHRIAKELDQAEIEYSSLSSKPIRSEFTQLGIDHYNGQKIPEANTTTQRERLAHRVRILRESLKYADAERQRIREEVAREYRAQLSDMRGEMLARLDCATADMIEALAALTTFYDDAERASVTSEWGIGQPWTSSHLGFGETRWVIERLEAWRKEFAETGFIAAK